MTTTEISPELSTRIDTLIDDETARFRDRQADPATRRGPCTECGAWGPSGEPCRECGGEGSHA